MNDLVATEIAQNLKYLTDISKISFKSDLIGINGGMELLKALDKIDGPRPEILLFGHQLSKAILSYLEFLEFEDNDNIYQDAGNVEVSYDEYAENLETFGGAKQFEGRVSNDEYYADEDAENKETFGGAKQFEGRVSNDEYYADEDAENKETFGGKGDKMMAYLLTLRHMENLQWTLGVVDGMTL